MFEDIKKHISEIVEIAQSCPENLQEKCFEVLLLSFFRSRGLRLAEETGIGPIGAESIVQGALTEVDEVARQEDIAEKNINVKVRKFLQDYGISIEQINQLFYLENGEFKPLYDDLETTQVAESQIRLALLEALENAMSEGYFEIDGESVREKCKAYKCYDSGNFASNFRNKAVLLDGFEQYESGTPIYLSKEGRKKLAELIKELSR